MKENENMSLMLDIIHLSTDKYPLILNTFSSKDSFYIIRDLKFRNIFSKILNIFQSILIITSQEKFHDFKYSQQEFFLIVKWHELLSLLLNIERP